jgi:hypothetical protein
MLWVRWRRGISEWMAGTLWEWGVSQGRVGSIQFAGLVIPGDAVPWISKA